MKIKNFNIPDFGRIFLGKKKEDELVTYKNIKHSFSISADRFDEEDKEVVQVILDSLKETGELPFEISQQETNYLRTSDINIWCEYLVFRYKLRVYPQLKKVAKFPVYMLIEPVSACNLRCVMCFQIDNTFTKKPYMGTMSLETFKKVVDEAVAGGTKAITMASRGEPLMHKKLPDMLEYARASSWKSR